MNLVFKARMPATLYKFMTSNSELPAVNEVELAQQFGHLPKLTATNPNLSMDYSSSSVNGEEAPQLRDQLYEKTYKVDLRGEGVLPYLKYTVDLLVRVDLKSFQKSTNGLSIPISVDHGLSYIDQRSFHIPYQSTSHPISVEP